MAVLQTRHAEKERVPVFDNRGWPQTRDWIRGQPDRPFVILFAHLLVVLLYCTHRAVSSVPFTSGTTHSVISSPVIPALHLLAFTCLAWAMLCPKHQGCGAVTSLFTWASTTVALYFAATQRNPPLALWAPALAGVVTVAAFLMAVRWGVDGDDREER